MVSKQRRGDDPGDAQSSGSGSGGSAKAQAPVRGGNIGSEYMAGYRQHAYEMRDQGMLGSQKLAQEIIYLLPDEFVTFYTGLFHQALQIGDSSVMAGKSGGLDKAKGAQGMVTGSEVKLQAQGSGKRWKNPAYTVGSERAFEIKGLVDRELLRIAGEARGFLVRLAAAEMDNGGGGQKPRDNEPSMGQTAPGSGAPIRCGGYRRSWVDRGDGVRPKCGTFLKKEWKYCPKCGWSTQA